MSAFPAPQSPTPANRPSPIPLPPQRSKAIWLVLAATAILAAAGTWALVRGRRAQPETVPAVRTVRAVRGTLVKTTRVSGNISTKRFANIVAPRLQAPDAGRGMVILYLPENGSRVKKGDRIALIDSQAIKDHLDDVDAQVTQLDFELRKLEAQQAAEMEAAKQQVRAARAKLEEARQDMRALDIRSTIDREILKLALEEAQADYRDASDELGLIRERQAAQRRIEEIDRETQASHRNRHRTDLLRCTITAPIDGQAVLKPINRNGQIEQVRVGDELSAGQNFMRIVDLSRMLLDGSMSQTDSQMLKLGQRATIHFDAYPDLVLRGHVESVGALAVSGRRTNYYVRTIPVQIAIESTDPRVIPDLTASADVVLEEDQGVLVPREAVQEAGGKAVVMVRQGETIAARPVEVGAYGSTQVSIASGLQDGDEIALQPEAAR